MDSAGNVYISDTLNNRIRVVAPNGTINTVIGTGAMTYSGDGGPATAATLNHAEGLSFDSAGNLYIADNGNNVIRQYAPPAATGGSLPTINAGGVISASSFGAFSAIAPGSWIEIYGSNLASTTANWNNSFTGVNAPTALANTTVTIGGLSAFIDYVSPVQVNAQVPSGVGSGARAGCRGDCRPAGQSAAFPITVNGTEPGIARRPLRSRWAPRSMWARCFPDGVTYVLPSGAISGLIDAPPAHVGETIVMYGVGFGPGEHGLLLAGQIVPQAPGNSLTTPLKLCFSGRRRLAVYLTSDLCVTPGYLWACTSSWNVVVPNVAASNAVPVTFRAG